jgi:hypothetical protein
MTLSRSAVAAPALALHAARVQAARPLFLGQRKVNRWLWIPCDPSASTPFCEVAL